ncbi:MAG TPA: sigma-70 family RNA polymerase sigma factor [Polyangia bacterium]|nr:sigma-70 family RNA polymerase sigma factor [Polyangia bacterium]
MGREDEVAFERLMDVHRAVLGRVVECYADTRADREDLSQEIGLALWRALPGFRGDCSERTFLVRIAHNRGVDFLVRRRRSATAPEADCEDLRPGPEDATGARERRELLFTALRTMPVGFRQVLALALEDLDHREIAEVVGITPENVAVRLSRARDMLRQKMRKVQ